MQKKAVILFSGGLDSTTCLALAKSQDFLIYAITFYYDQKHEYEVIAAKEVALQMGVVEHKILTLSFKDIGGSALIDHDIQVPDYVGDHKIPTTYVPARNTVFLSLALGWAEVIGAFDIFIGANILDYSGYPDCRPEYLAAFEKMANLATKTAIEENGQFKIHAPLLHWNKQQIIEAGLDLGIDYRNTVSCYRLNAKGEACGKCDSCFHRQKGFNEANVLDPTRYAI